MSLYCFGKIVPIGTAESLEQCTGQVGRLFLRDIDPEDLAIICEFENLKQAGIAFSYADGEDEFSATGLWLAASEIANQFPEVERSSYDVDYSDAIKATTLGSFVWSLLNCPKIKYGALALVDGGVDTIHQVSAGECWNHFLKIIPGSWDCHDNPLFIWQNESPSGTGSLRIEPG